MPTALIADDEPLLAQDLARRLGQLWPELEIAAIAPNGAQALVELARCKPDFAFLDIRMPGMDGLQVAQAAHDSRVVFVTAYDEYAISAFDAAAADYLLKPVSDARLAQCVARLQREVRGSTDLVALAKQLIQPKPAQLNWLHVGVGNNTRLVAVEEVLYFQASDKYTEAVTHSERHIIRTPLKELLEQLDPARFSQVHRSTIVALAAVAHIERDLLGRLRIHLKGERGVLPLSRSFAGQFRQM